MLKLLPGLHHFKTEVHSANQEFFSHLTSGQTPDAVFITCSDSRIDPGLLTQTRPGDLFTLRNVGNIVPASGDSLTEESAIEYAVEVLGVRNIIVCGHSHCGAMQALLQPETLESLPVVRKWLKNASTTYDLVRENYSDLDFECQWSIAIQENVLVQLEHLRQLPCIARRLWKREIELHGWVYQLETGEVHIYDLMQEAFVPFARTEGGFKLIDAAEADAAQSCI